MRALVNLRTYTVYDHREISGKNTVYSIRIIIVNTAGKVADSRLQLKWFVINPISILLLSVSLMYFDIRDIGMI